MNILPTKYWCLTRNHEALLFILLSIIVNLDFKFTFGCCKNAQRISFVLQLALHSVALMNFFTGKLFKGSSSEFLKQH